MTKFPILLALLALVLCGCSTTHFRQTAVLPNGTTNTVELMLRRYPFSKVAIKGASMPVSGGTARLEGYEYESKDSAMGIIQMIGEAYAKGRSDEAASRQR